VRNKWDVFIGEAVPIAPEAFTRNRTRKMSGKKDYNLLPLIFRLIFNKKILKCRMGYNKKSHGNHGGVFKNRSNPYAELGIMAILPGDG
jgi:hypothetical protein